MLLMPPPHKICVTTVTTDWESGDFEAQYYSEAVCSYNKHIGPKIEIYMLALCLGDI